MQILVRPKESCLLTGNMAQSGTQISSTDINHKYSSQISHLNLFLSLSENVCVRLSFVSLYFTCPPWIFLARVSVYFCVLLLLIYLCCFYWTWRVTPGARSKIQVETLPLQYRLAVQQRHQIILPGYHGGRKCWRDWRHRMALKHHPS